MHIFGYPLITPTFQGSGSLRPPFDSTGTSAYLCLGDDPQPYTPRSILVTHLAPVRNFHEITERDIQAVERPLPPFELGVGEGLPQDFLLNIQAVNAGTYPRSLRRRCKHIASRSRQA